MNRCVNELKRPRSPRHDGKVDQPFRIEQERRANGTLLRLYILDQKVPVATAYLRRAEEGPEIVSRQINCSSYGYMSLEATVALIEGLVQLVLRAESEK